MDAYDLYLQRLTKWVIQPERRDVHPVITALEAEAPVFISAPDERMARQMAEAAGCTVIRVEGNIIIVADDEGH